ncbi:MAG TPA: tetratricopeptide repeat protein [Candidatus Angelobacter sp.]|nr:tetratricopeptide repeat protein [Candidatus Angelobacter sp.]
MKKLFPVLHRVVPALVLAAASHALVAQSPATAAPDRMPITTSSPEARALFDQGIVAWENLRIPQALQCWQKAIEKDPNFLLAHLYISERIPDPDQQAQELKKVTALMDSVTPDERLMAEWILERNRDNTIGALAAMNELLNRYPRDKHLYWFAALFVGTNYHQWDRAGELAAQAVHVDPDFAGALNNLGYDYAFQGKFDQAFPVMQHYIEVLPNEPNPQDSYAEILRMAGRFDEAVDHYHAALKLDPNFGESLLGLADTFALMGQEDKARAQYDIAIQHAYTKAYAVEWKLKWAATYLREKRFSDADAAFQAAATMAHENSVGVLEAEAYRVMALYHKDEASSRRWMQKAKESLEHPHDTSRGARQEALGSIDRVIIYNAIRYGHLAEAETTLSQLSKIAQDSNNPNLDITFHASAGMILAAKQKWLEAIPHLEEDANDPFSMELLVKAYQKAGLPAKAERTARELAAMNAPSVEQALIVPEFRAARNTAANKLPERCCR